jgi:type IX secretion system substrate protein
MKKFLLLGLVLNVGFMASAQTQYKPVSTHAPKDATIEQVAKKASPLTSAQKYNPSQTDNDKGLTFVNIGSSGNAYGFYSGPRTYLWADNNIKSAVFTHRMIVDPPTSYGNSRVAYDLSIDGGETWTSNIQVYDPTGPGSTYPDDAGRYPEGGILNPYGNTDPANAFYTYFIPTLSNTNDAWGGYAWGVNPLTTIDPPTPTQTNLTTVPPTRYIPDAMTITQQGVSWIADNTFDATALEYLGQFIFEKGMMNETTGDIEYTEWTMDVGSEADGVNDSKIAFDPSGQIGYLLVMTDAAGDPQPFTSYHPVLYATTDGGEIWSEEPNHCLLGGPDGIAEIKNYISDEVLEIIFGAGFDREAIPYNMGFHADLAVDYKGNAHITGLLSAASDEGWYPNPDVMGTFHIWYDRETGIWDAHLLYMNRTFDGDLGGINQYNRPQISSDMEGHFFFFSWIDTDQEDVTDNISPDLYYVSYDMFAAENNYSEVTNVTSFTQAMWTAYFASQSHYVFADYSEDFTEITFTVPFVYEACDPADPAAEVTFWYIDGHTDVMPNYWIGVNENQVNPIASVEQNFPNPFSSSTMIEVSLENNANLSMEVVNMIGQKVLEVNKGQVQSGTHTFEISAENMKSGIYFYTVKANENTVTKKMIVE